MRTYLCVIEVLQSGELGAVEVEAADVVVAGRMARDTGTARFGRVAVVDIVRTDLVDA